MFALCFKKFSTLTLELNSLMQNASENRTGTSRYLERPFFLISIFCTDTRLLLSYLSLLFRNGQVFLDMNSFLENRNLYNMSQLKHSTCVDT